MIVPISTACERNRSPILEVLRKHFAGCRRAIEIGSGTGQHAEYFAAALPQLEWQATERPAHLAGLTERLTLACLTNTPAPFAFDVNDPHWPAGVYDALFSANTLHIMSWAEVERLFAGIPELLAPGAKMTVYGPFNYAGGYTSDSNAAFDAWLKAQAPHRGIRDFEAVNELAAAAGLVLDADLVMPANNRCLVWSLKAAAQT